MINSSIIVDEVVKLIESLDRDQLSKSLRAGKCRISNDKLRVELEWSCCKAIYADVEIVLTGTEALEKLHKALESRLGYAPFVHTGQAATHQHILNRLADESGIPQHFHLDSSAIASLSGLINMENTSPEQLQAITKEQIKPQYSHDEIYGQFCFRGGHIDVPFEVAFDYIGNIHSLPEWTLSLRNLRHLGGGLYVGSETIESADPNRPNTQIFIRASSLRGADFGAIVHSCAWDQGYELWMRYNFLLIDAQKTINKPGATTILWVNCKHPYYDTSNTNVPSYIKEGQERTDRQWVGELWDAFYPFHSMEMSNLKRVLEYRFKQLHTIP